jgi:hypothetical protein
LKTLLKYIFAITLSINTPAIFSQAYTWEPLGSAAVNGVNGDVYAVTSYNGKIIAGGLFTLAGTLPVNNIAAYDPATGLWSAIGSGTNASGEKAYSSF